LRWSEKTNVFIFFESQTGRFAAGDSGPSGTLDRLNGLIWPRACVCIVTYATFHRCVAKGTNDNSLSDDVTIAWTVALSLFSEYI